jgi:hypothetical protein
LVTRKSKSSARGLKNQKEVGKPKKNVELRLPPEELAKAVKAFPPKK